MDAKTKSKSKYSREQRADKAARIVEAMREVYETEGIEGDFDDGERHLRDDANDDELDADFEEWVSNAPKKGD